MRIIHEAIDYGNNIPVRVFIQQLGYSSLHWHESIEIIFVIEGFMRLNVSGKEEQIEKGKAFLINSSIPHEVHADGKCIAAVIQIQLSLFDHNLFQDDPLYFHSRLTDHDPAGINKIKRICALFLKNYLSVSKDRIYRAKSLSYHLLAELITYYKTDKPTEQEELLFYQHERVVRITDYVQEHFREPISLQHIAEREFLSIQYLSKFFTKTIGISFFKYLNQIRLSHAVNDLQETDLSIEAIAESNGFANAKSFVRAMKEQYGVLPSYYRNNFTKIDGDSTSEVVSDYNNYTILNNTNYFQWFAESLKERPSDLDMAEYAADQTESIIIDAQLEGKKLRHTFRNFTSVACAADLLLNDVQDMLTVLQKEVGFRYLKFHGIFDDQLHVYSKKASQEEPDYCFLYVDKVLDFLLSIHLKPMIELSFMPKDMALMPENRIFETSMINSPPMNLEFWCNLVRTFLLHIMERYGDSEVEQWMFTVWNEPDTPQHMFGFPAMEQFFEFYQATWQVLKTVDPNIQIASPSMYYDKQDNASWFCRFTDWTREHTCMADAVLFHCYGSEIADIPIFHNDLKLGIKHKLRISTDPSILSKSIDAFQACVHNLYPTDTKIFLTEWNYTPYHYDLLGDTCFRSCYLVKNILENYDKIESMGYWTLTDLMAEHYLKQELFQGGLGLFTYNGIKKPAYYAFVLLSKLGDFLIDQGDGYFLTKKGSQYQLLLYNYSHFSEIYAMGEQFDITNQNRYTAFGPESKKIVTVELHNLPAKQWRVKEFIVNRKHGSSFDMWIEMGAEDLKEREDLELLSALSAPMLKQYCSSSAKDKLTIRAELSMLEIRLILIQ